jgi:glycosyltransferase involved in cell wall biosynthesis
MRILQVSSARHFGGGERHFVDLTNALVRRGHDVYAALIPDSPLLPELAVSDDHILRLSIRNSLDLTAAWKVRKFTREHAIEIIHAHVARDYPLAALAVPRDRPARLVLTRHVLFPLSTIHRLTRRRTSRVIAVSEAVAATLRSQSIFGEDQIVVIQHGIALERFRTESGRDRERVERLRVGMLGELSPLKGQVDFVRAAAIVAAQRPDVEFVICGQDASADGSNRRDIETLAEKLGLSSRVRLVDERIENVAQFLSDLDVFVSASHSEAFGLAIVEAMACGVPVVATMTDGAREIIEDGRTGRLVPISGVDDMAHAIAELLSDEKRRGELAENACRVVTERYSLERMVDETEEVYRKILVR